MLEPRQRWVSEHRVCAMSQNRRFGIAAAVAPKAREGLEGGDAIGLNRHAVAVLPGPPKHPDTNPRNADPAGEL